ncbi:MAG: hypothetical protein ACYDEX_10745 [Mobilitalea sp.]
MYKAKLCGFAIACMVGFVGINPISAYAADTNTESATLSETNKSEKDNKAAFEEKMKVASEKWQALSAKQKNEVYTLLEKDLQAEIKLLDKLVKLCVLEKADVEIIKAHMLNRFKEVKESGELPIPRPKGKKSSK